MSEYMNFHIALGTTVCLTIYSDGLYTELTYACNFGIQQQNKQVLKSIHLLPRPHLMGPLKFLGVLGSVGDVCFLLLFLSSYGFVISQSFSG